MLTFEDIKQIDVKDLDIGLMIKNLRQRKDILVNIVIVAISIIFALKILGQNATTGKQLQIETEVLQEKAEALNTLNQAKDHLTSYVKSLPKGFNKVDGLIDKINEVALRNNVEILSFSPTRDNNTEFYDQIGVRLNIEAQSYADIGYFIRDIENSNDIILVEEWSMQSQQKQQSRYLESPSLGIEEDSKISAQVEMRSIKFKL